MMKLWNNVYQPMVLWAFTILPKTQPNTILDIGVGNGTSTFFIANTFPNAEVYGIDFSAEAITTSKKAANRSNSAVQFSQQDILSTTFHSNSFQLITAFQTHFHWSDQERAFTEIYRILEKDGLLLVACEMSKINYYTKYFAKPENFIAFLAQRGFSQISFSTHRGWITYIARK